MIKGKKEEPRGASRVDRKPEWPPSEDRKGSSPYPARDEFVDTRPSFARDDRRHGSHETPRASMYSAVVPIDRGEGRPAIWHKIGVAFGGEGPNRDGFSVILNSIPTGSWDGKFYLFPLRDKE